MFTKFIEQSQETLSKKYLKALLSSGAISIAQDSQHLFFLRNGTQSAIYVDHGRVICDPVTYFPFIEALRSKIALFSANYILVNVDSKCSAQITGTLAFISGFRQIAVTSFETSLIEKGVRLSIRYPKNIQPYDKFYIIDDVYTEGDKTALNVISRVRKKFIEDGIDFPLHFEILVGLNRSDKIYVKSNEGDQIMIHSVLTMKDIFDSIKESLNVQQKEALLNEINKTKAKL